MTDSRGGTSRQEAQDLEAAETLLRAQSWAAARPILQRLAAANRAERRYRALLAFTLGHEAKDAGDLVRARAEWDRAITLDPSLAERGIRRRSALVQRLFGRL